MGGSLDPRSLRPTPGNTVRPRLYKKIKKKRKKEEVEEEKEEEERGKEEKEAQEPTLH